VSIDEAYLDMTGRDEPMAMAEKIKTEIYESLGFTVNIGISTVKLLAKMASDFEKPYKVHTLYPEEIKEKMWIGVKTIGDAAMLDKALLCSLLGEKSGEYIYESANGRGSNVVSGEREAAKSYSNETTLPTDIRVSTYDREMPPVIHWLSESVGKRLTKDEAAGYTISVSAKTSSFKRRSKQTTLVEPTNDVKDIESTSLILMRELCFGERGLFSENDGIRLVGVGVSNLAENECKQLDIFSYMKEKSAQDEIRLNESKKKEKTDKLDTMLKKINEKYGEGKIKKGG